MEFETIGGKAFLVIFVREQKQVDTPCENLYIYIYVDGKWKTSTMNEDIFPIEPWGC